jgi:hypothetical protein
LAGTFPELPAERPKQRAPDRDAVAAAAVQWPTTLAANRDAEAVAVAAAAVQRPTTLAADRDAEAVAVARPAEPAVDQEVKQFAVAERPTELVADQEMERSMGLAVDWEPEVAALGEQVVEAEQPERLAAVAAEQPVALPPQTRRTCCKSDDLQ